MRSELTVTVTPGYTLTEGESPTVDILNQLGSPTVEVSGTIDGTVGLSAASVSGTHLTDSVVDGIYIDWTNSAPRAITIKPGSITTNLLATNIFGVAISGGVNSKANVLVDTNTITVNADNQLTLDTNVFGTPGFYWTNNQVYITNFVSTNFPVPTAASVLTNTHSLGAVPAWTRCVLVCTNTDLGYVSGDEIPIESVIYNNASYHTPVAHTMANATQLLLVAEHGNRAWQVYTKSLSGRETITKANWNIKFYARRQ